MLGGENMNNSDLFTYSVLKGSYKGEKDDKLIGRKINLLVCGPWILKTNRLKNHKSFISGYLWRLMGFLTEISPYPLNVLGENSFPIGFF